MGGVFCFLCAFSARAGFYSVITVQNILPTYPAFQSPPQQMNILHEPYRQGFRPAVSLIRPRPRFEHGSDSNCPPSLFLPISSLPGHWWPHLPSLTLPTGHHLISVSHFTLFHAAGVCVCWCSVCNGEGLRAFHAGFFFLNLRALDRSWGKPTASGVYIP